MNATFIISTVLLIAIVFLLIKVIKNAISLGISLFMLFIVVIAAFFFIDPALMPGFSGKQKLFLLEDDGYIAGFTMQGNNITGLSGAELSGIDDPTDLDYNRVFVIHEEALGNATTKNALIEKVGVLDDENLDFGLRLIGKLKNPFYMIKQYRKGNIDIYPKTLILKLLKNG